MSVSAQFAALDALVAMTTTAIGSNATVLDGPIPTGQVPYDYVVIGVADASEPADWPDASQAQTEWKTHGNAATGVPPKIDEYLTIYGFVVAWDGSASFSTLRARAKTNLALIEAAIRADGTLQGVTLYARLTLVGIRQIWSDNGPAVQAKFEIEARARI